MSDFESVRLLDVEVGDIFHQGGKPYRVGKIYPGDNRETLTLELDGYFSRRVTYSTLITVLIVKRRLLKRWYQELDIPLASNEEVRERLIRDNPDIAHYADGPTARRPYLESRMTPESTHGVGYIPGRPFIQDYRNGWIILVSSFVSGGGFGAFVASIINTIS